MKVKALPLLLAGMLAFAGCQRETMNPNNDNNPADTTGNVVVPDTVAALDTATLQNLYVAFIVAKNAAQPYDSAYFRFSYLVNYFDTVINGTSLENAGAIRRLPHSLEYTYITAYPSSRYTTRYYDTAYHNHTEFYLDYYLTNGQPYYINAFNEYFPKTFSDSTLRMYYVYNADGKLKEIFNYNNNKNQFEQNDKSHFFDDRNFVYDGDGNILSDEVMDSGDEYHYKTYRYEYSNRASRICLRKNTLPFSQCRLFDHSLYLFENFFKREVVRITETETDLTGGTPVTSAPIVHDYSYKYNSKGWVSVMTDKVTGGSNPLSLEYSFYYFNDIYFRYTSAF